MSDSVVSTKMPTCTATTKHKHFFRFPVTKRCNNPKECVKLMANIVCRDKRAEKVFDRREGVKTAKPHKRKRKQNFIQRTFETLTHHHNKADRGNKSAYDEHSYKDELAMYIAESSANLCHNDGPLDSSDDETSEEEFDPVPISPRSAKIIDFSPSIISISSDKTEEFVVPPVEVPCKYHRQDCKGGVLVAGRYVLFTNWAFKRQMHHMGRLGSLPECGEAQPHSVDKVSVGLYSGKIVEL